MTRQKCPNKKDNEKNCPCEELDCPRHGVCCECIKFHKENPENGLPACLS